MSTISRNFPAILWNQLGQRLFIVLCRREGQGNEDGRHTDKARVSKCTVNKRGFMHSPGLI